MARFVRGEDPYLADFARLEKNGAFRDPSWLWQIRRGAIARFAELGFPTTRDEEWKYTSVEPMVRVPFKHESNGKRGLTAEAWKEVSWARWASQRLVFVNGRYVPELSSWGSLPRGVQVGSLAEALRTHPALVEPHLAQYAGYRDHAFVALNTAFMEDGAFVVIPPGSLIEEPLHVLFLSAAYREPQVFHPRSLILIGSSSQVTLIESYLGFGGGTYWTNAVTELVLEENAVVEHCRVEVEDPQAFHVATLQAHLGRNSHWTSCALAWGGSLVRNDLNVVLDGEGAGCTLDGLYLARGQQHIDNHTRIDHVKPHGSSRELYKGILWERAHGVFNGKIYVHKTAPKTDAHQLNKNLLLSDQAIIDTKPQLEIYADDVRCSHGSTIGQLDPDALFYLRSRGIGGEEARSLLIYAFAVEVLGRLKAQPVRTQLEHLLATQLRSELAG